MIGVSYGNYVEEEVGAVCPGVGQDGGEYIRRVGREIGQGVEVPNRGDEAANVNELLVRDISRRGDCQRRSSTAAVPAAEEGLDARLVPLAEPLAEARSEPRIDPGGYHLGLAQFDPGTWATVSKITGYMDWRDAFSQGFNTATWASMVAPGSRSGWPSCWWAW